MSSLNGEYLTNVHKTDDAPRKVGGEGVVGSFAQVCTSVLVLTALERICWKVNTRGYENAARPGSNRENQGRRNGKTSLITHQRHRYTVALHRVHYPCRPTI